MNQFPLCQTSLWHRQSQQAPRSSRSPTMKEKRASCGLIHYLSSRFVGVFESMDGEWSQRIVEVNEWEQRTFWFVTSGGNRIGSGNFFPSNLGDFAIIERELASANDLFGFVTFASDQHAVAGSGVFERPGDCGSSVRIDM